MSDTTNEVAAINQIDVEGEKESYLSLRKPNLSCDFSTLLHIRLVRSSLSRKYKFSSLFSVQTASAIITYYIII